MKVALLNIGTPISGDWRAPFIGEGITRNQIETEKIIKALVDVERAILDQLNVCTRFKKIECVRLLSSREKHLI